MSMLPEKVFENLIKNSRNNSRRFTLEVVSSPASLRREWHPLLLELFTDPNDVETLAELQGRLKEKDLNSFRLLRHEGKPIGLELLQVHPEIPQAMYVPWAGVSADYRNQSIYPLMAEISNKQMKAQGVKYALYDFEDPARIAVAYPDEPPEQAQKRAEGRINFWRRAFLKEDKDGKPVAGCYVVTDPDIPYIRPASDDPKKIQAYDLLAVHPLSEEDPMWKGVFNEDKTQMRKAAYRDFFLEINRLQYGNLSEEELCRDYPAIKQFLKVLDENPKQWVSVESKPVRKKNLIPVAQRNEVVPAPDPLKPDHKEALKQDRALPAVGSQSVMTKQDVQALREQAIKKLHRQGMKP